MPVRTSSTVVESTKTVRGRACPAGLKEVEGVVAAANFVGGHLPVGLDAVLGQSSQHALPAWMPAWPRWIE